MPLERKAEAALLVAKSMSTTMVKTGRSREEVVRTAAEMRLSKTKWRALPVDERIDPYTLCKPGAECDRKCDTSSTRMWYWKMWQSEPSA